jgi:hypothetical protein
MTRLLRRRTFVTIAATAVVCSGLAACSSNSNGGHGPSSSNIPALVMESSPETAITQAFNPFVATQAAYGMGGAAEVLPVAGHRLQVVGRREGDYFHDSIGREVEQRHGPYPGRRRLHL